MRLLAVLALLAAPLGHNAGAPTPTPTPTQVSFWSPFTASGAVKPTLKVERLGSGRCGRGVSERVGFVGYRCTSGDWLADPCFRAKAAPTSLVVCVFSPWSRSVDTILVPHLMFDAGVTHSPWRPTDIEPWAIELRDGRHCDVLQGAHSAVTIADGRRVAIDYACSGGIGLLRNVRRGRTWHATAVKFHERGQTIIGDIAIRRVFFAVLPPRLARQNALARDAVAATPIPHRRVFRVRMAFPRLEWASVQSWTGAWTVVRRRGPRWRVVHDRRRPCRRANLSPSVRRQLFGCFGSVLPAR